MDRKSKPRPKKSKEGPSEISLVNKYVLFFLNFICWVIGLIMVGIGVWAWYDRGALDSADSLDSLVQSPIVDPSWWLVVLGSIIFVIATCGCIGALRENTMLLNIYKVAMGLILLLEIGGGVAIYLYQDTIEDKFADLLFDLAIPGYRENADFQDLIDTVQTELKCCGVKGYNDWNNNLYFNCSHEMASANRVNPEACGVPFSCCRQNETLSYEVINTQCGYNVRREDFDDVLRKQTIYTSGCVEVFQTWLVNRFNFYAIAGVGAAILIVEVIGFCFALTLTNDIQRQKSKW